MESVWDFPRPPRIELVEWRIRVIHGGTTVVDAPRAWRVLETSQPPAYYVAPDFVDGSRLSPSDLRTTCEWKGVAEYAHVITPPASAVAPDAAPDTAPPLFNAAWSYPSPTEPFADIAGHWAFYAQKLDACFVDDEAVVSNDGGFYGGWITNNVTGPFKGSPGTMHW
jgi:uncharacterized protein (DUF427 family)